MKLVLSCHVVGEERSKLESGVHMSTLYHLYLRLQYCKFFSPCPALHYFASLVLLDILYLYIFIRSDEGEGIMKGMLNI